MSATPFTRLVDRAIPPGRHETPESRRAARLAVGTYGIVTLSTGYYAVQSALIGYPPGAWGQGQLFFVSLACLALYRVGVRPGVVAGLFFGSAVLAISISTAFSGGFESPVLLWLATSPIAALLVAGKRAGIGTLAAVLGVISWFYWLHLTGGTPANAVPERYRETLSITSFLGMPVIVFVIGIIFERFKEEALDSLGASNAELATTLDRLRTTQRQLVHAEKMASLGSLTAGIAHEIKNPLNFVTNFAKLSQDLLGELDGAASDDERAEILQDLRDNAEKIESHGRRADRIVRSMMDHARDGSGNRQTVALAPLVEEYVGLAVRARRALYPTSSPSVDLRLSPETGAVEVIPEEIGRVLINLTENALDAVREGGTVTVSTRRLADGVEIRVEDDGPGMVPDVAGRVFEPFFTTKPTGQGTGLGLSMSYDIVADGHGGTLAVETAPGEGAAFVLTLPTRGDR